MLQENSGRLQLDWRNIMHICGAGFIGVLSIYASNTEFFNTILEKNISKDNFIVLTMVLSYFVKKLLTDYSNK